MLRHIILLRFPWYFLGKEGLKKLFLLSPIIHTISVVIFIGLMAQIIKPRKVGVSALKKSILNTALTTHYECWFNPPGPVRSLITGVEKDENYTLSCLEAALPGTSLATVELQNDHSGITERHVNRRQYDTTASFTFYVDRYYRQIKLFETWIGYIVNEQNRQDENYFYRVNFPKQYQTSIWITKFERDFNKPRKNLVEVDDTRSLTYLFLNAYPISIDSMPVSYEGAQTLKCTVNFNFSRYITGATAPTPLTYPVTGESLGVNEFQNPDLFERDYDIEDGEFRETTIG